MFETVFAYIELFTAFNFYIQLLFTVTTEQVLEGMRNVQRMLYPELSVPETLAPLKLLSMQCNVLVNGVYTLLLSSCVVICISLEFDSDWSMFADLNEAAASYQRINSAASILDEPLRLASGSLASSRVRLEPSASQQLGDAAQYRDRARDLESPSHAFSGVSPEQQQHYLRTRSFDEMSLHHMATGLSLGRPGPAADGAFARRAAAAMGAAGLGREGKSAGEIGGLSFTDLRLDDFEDAASDAQSTVESEFPGAGAGFSSQWPSSLTQQPLYVQYSIILNYFILV